MEDADDVRAGKDDPEFEGELCGLVAGSQLVRFYRHLSFPQQQVPPLLLYAGYLVTDTPGACADFRGCGDEEAASGEDPPFNI